METPRRPSLSSSPRRPATSRAPTSPVPASPAPTSPGLAKIRAVPLVQRRTVELCAAAPGRWGEIVERADIVSEGRARLEGDLLVYYGSTSVLLLRRSAGGELPDADLPAIAALLRADPHVRLRVLRLARREAEGRAPPGAPLGTLHAEIDVAASARGVALLVEVVARLAHGVVRGASGADR